MFKQTHEMRKILVAKLDLNHIKVCMSTSKYDFLYVLFMYVALNF